MNRSASWLVLGTMLLVSMAPTVAAAPAHGHLDAAAPLLLSGELEATSVGAHVLARALPAQQPFTFTLEAEAATSTEVYANQTVVRQPARSDSTLVRYEDPQETRTTTFISPRMQAVELRPGATAFVYPLEGGEHRATLLGGRAATLTADDAARITGRDAPEPTGEGGKPLVRELDYRLDTPHVRLAAFGHQVQITGDFALHLWNVTVEVAADGKEDRIVTGEFTRFDGGAASRVTRSNATLLLRDATLTFTLGEEPAHLLGAALDLTLDGDARIPSASGVLQLDARSRHVARDEDVHAAGALRFTAHPSTEDAQRIRLATAGDLERINLPVQTSGITIPATVAEDAEWWAAGTGLLALGIGAVVALRNRDLDRPLLRRGKGAPDATKAAEEAVVALSAGEYAVALEHLDAALESDPENSDLLVDRGFCLEKLGDAQGARLAYERALLADPGRAETHYYYARALCTLGLTTTALSHVGRALALDERLREQAQDDPAFGALRDHPQFLSLVGL